MVGHTTATMVDRPRGRGPGVGVTIAIAIIAGVIDLRHTGSLLYRPTPMSGLMRRRTPMLLVRGTATAIIEGVISLPLKSDRGTPR